MSEKGMVLEYAQNSYSSWIRMAKESWKRRKGKISELDDQELRRYTFDRVVEYNPLNTNKDRKDEFSFKEKFITAFDITYLLDNGLNMLYFIEMLKISFKLTQTQNLTQLFPPIYLCHSKVYVILAKQLKIPLEQLYSALLSVT